LRIIDAVAHRMEVPIEKVLINIQHYGNTSAATLPLCIWDFEDRLKKGDNMLFTAFGAGFVWGAVYVKWGYDGKQRRRRIENEKQLQDIKYRNASYSLFDAFFLSNNKNHMHKAGFVNIVGNPNVGKSTLMNLLVGERISIATFKAQTTRHRIMGIVNTDDMQIVFSDTPGVLKPKYKLQESMLNFSESALVDADVLLYVTDMVEKIDKNMDFIKKVNLLQIPVLLLINKIDLSNQEELEKRVEEWKDVIPRAEIIPVSALAKFNADYVMKRIQALLPDSPPYFEKDQLTDKPARFFVSEIIREKILLYYDKEIPYSVEVVIDSFKEDNKRIVIRAIIYVERDSQRGIIIGKQGRTLKKVGTEARRDLERFFDKSIYLETFVKVDKDWRSSEKELQNFGYDSKE
jgi:GTP-binding protein Era